jgi:hypothetical protein
LFIIRRDPRVTSSTLPAGTPIDPVQVEVREQAMQRVHAEGAKYIWVLILAVVPIHWFRTGPRQGLNTRPLFSST